jgi:transcriptional regulator with PAS, ATPase and Fis domain
MLMTTLKEAEIRHIQQVLASVKGNKTQACKILGIGRATLYGKLGSPNGA